MRMPQSSVSSTLGGKLIASVKKKKNVDNYEKSIRICDTVWATEPSGKAADTRSTPGHMFEDSYAEHIAALTESKKSKSTFDAPFNEQLNAAASWTRVEAARHLDSVMDGEGKTKC